jgi:hypothetical protein
MMCLCKRTYYDKNTLGVIFHKDRYYKHLGSREMLGENGNIVGFGKLDNWVNYFVTIEEHRDKKLEELGI